MKDLYQLPDCYFIDTNKEEFVSNKDHKSKKKKDGKDKRTRREKRRRKREY